MHIWGTYVHMCTKYEVSMYKPVPGGVQYDDDANANDTNDDRQFMIVQMSKRSLGRIKVFCLSANDSVWLTLKRDSTNVRLDSKFLDIKFP